MKLSSIQANYNVKNNNQSFKGLWSVHVSPPDKDEVMGLLRERHTLYYYPFLDESKSEITNTMNSHNADFFQNGRLITKQSVLCATLPFTKADYARYEAANENSEISPTLKLVHEHAKTKYKSIKEEHVTAVNDAVTKHINMLY